MFFVSVFLCFCFNKLGDVSFKLKKKKKQETVLMQWLACQSSKIRKSLKQWTSANCKWHTKNWSLPLFQHIKDEFRKKRDDTSSNCVSTDNSNCWNSRLQINFWNDDDCWYIDQRIKYAIKTNITFLLLFIFFIRNQCSREREHNYYIWNSTGNNAQSA